MFTIHTELSQLAAQASPNPYPGLRAFRLSESGQFFGRESSMAEGVRLLAEQRLLVVTGAEEVGKSSWVYAGLLPRLFSGEVVTGFSSMWECVAFEPGSHPMHQLALAFSANEADYAAHLQTLATSETWLADQVRRRWESTRKNVVLVVDQWEEMYRFAGLNKELDITYPLFTQQLWRAWQAADVPFHLVVTLPKAYLPSLSNIPEWKGAFGKATLEIPAFSAKEIAGIAVLQAQAKGAEMDPALVQRLEKDLAKTQAGMVQVQHALQRTWDYWTDNRYRNEPMGTLPYEQAGGLENALTEHLNHLVGVRSLDGQQKKITEKLFKTVTGMPDRAVVSLPATLPQLANIAGGKAEGEPNDPTFTYDLEAVVRLFAEQGFLIKREKPYDAQDQIIEISYDSLIDRCRPIREWIEQERESVKLYMELATLAIASTTGGELLTPGKLQIAQNWLKQESPTKAWGVRHHPAYEATLAYIAQSDQAIQDKIAAEQQMQEAKLKRNRLISFIFAGAFIIAAFLAGVAYFSSKKAKTAEKIAISARQAAEDSAKVAQRERALARDAERRALDSAEVARQQRLLALDEAARADREAIAARNARDAAYLSAIAARRAEKRALDSAEVARQQRAIAETQRLAAEKAEAEAARLRLLALAKSIAVKSKNVNDDTIQSMLALQAYIYHNRNGGDPYDPDIYTGLYYALSEVTDASPFLVNTGDITAISPINAQRFASAGSDGLVNFVEVGAKNLTRTASLPHPGAIFKAMDLSRTSKAKLVTGTNRGELLISKTDGTDQGRLERIPNYYGLPVLAVKSLNDNTFLCALGVNVLSVTISNDNRITAASALVQETSDVLDIEVHPTQPDVIYYTTRAGKLVRFNLKNRNAMATVQHLLPLWSVGISPSSRYLIAGDQNGNLLIYNELLGLLSSTVPQWHVAAVKDILFSGDGKLMATAGLDNKAVLWKVENGRNWWGTEPVVLNDYKEGEWVWALSFLGNQSLITGGVIVSGKNARTKGVKYWKTDLSELFTELNEIANKRQFPTMDEWKWKTFIGENVGYQHTVDTLRRYYPVK